MLHAGSIGPFWLYLALFCLYVLPLCYRGDMPCKEFVAASFMVIHESCARLPTQGHDPVNMMLMIPEACQDPFGM